MIIMADFLFRPPKIFRDAVVNYGSVMVCMKWGSAKGDQQCRMDNYKRGDVVRYPCGTGGL